MLRRIGLVVWVLTIASPAPGEGDKESVSELLTRGGEIRAEQIHPSIWLASGTSNVYLVATPDGAVVIDTGNAPQAVSSHLALQGAVGDLAVKKLVLTHAHEDHVGGVARWQGDDVEVIAHRYFPLRQHYYAMLEESAERKGFTTRIAAAPW